MGKVLGEIHVSPVHDGVRTIGLSGEIETGSFARLRHALVSTVMHGGCTGIVVDAAAVTAIDPLAIGALRAAHEVAQDLGLTFTIRADRSPVAAALASAGLPLSA